MSKCAEPEIITYIGEKYWNECEDSKTHPSVVGC